MATQWRKWLAVGRGQDGFLVIELLVAIMILMVPMLALMEMMPMAAQGILQGREITTATFQAETRMEELQHAEWTTFQDTLQPAYWPPEPTRTTTIEGCDQLGVDCGGVTSPAMRRVTVAVSYGLNNASISTLTALIARGN